MFGTTHIKGTGQHAGQTLDVWFKNENHVSWLNGKPWACSPDLVILAQRESGEGITNTQIRQGDEVPAVGIKGLEEELVGPGATDYERYHCGSVARNADYLLPL
jgi:DUF917 family protein